jgi:hypothetical protein
VAFFINKPVTIHRHKAASRDRLELADCRTPNQNSLP